MKPAFPPHRYPRPLNLLLILALFLPFHLPTAAAEVTADPHPDLVITDIWNDGSALCYQLYNQGASLVSPGHTSLLQRDSATLATDTFELALKPGERVNRCLNIQWSCTPLQDEIQVCADYKGVIEETDENNNCRQETWKCDSTPPTIFKGPQVLQAGQTSAVIYWETDESADSRVEYGRTAGAFNDWLQYPQFTTVHQVTLDNLQPGSLYQLRARSSDESGNAAVSKPLYFHTKPLEDTQAPQPGAPQIKRLEGDFVAYDIGVPVTDDQGVDRVQLLLDGLPVGLDYSPDPGTNTYRFMLLPGAMGFSHLDFFDRSHLLEVKALDRVGETIASTPWSPDPEPMDGEVEILSPPADFTMYIAEDIAPFLTELPIQVYAVENEAEICPPPGIGGESACIHRTHSVSQVDFYINSELMHTSIPALPNPEIHEYTWDASFKPVGDYHLLVVATAADGAILTASRDIHIRTGAMDLSVQRSVTRVNTWFQVRLTLRNHGTLTAILWDLQDTLTGFQVLPNRTDDYEVLTDFNAWYDTTRVTINFSEAGESAYHLDPGESYTVEYTAVPFRRMADLPLSYAIGSEPLSLHYRTLGFYDERWLSFDLPCRVTASGQRLGDAIDQAIIQADYLIVTNPGLLYTHNASAADVDWLLSVLAELAVVKQGTIGYLSGLSYNDRVIDEVIEAWGAPMKGSDGVAGDFLSNGYLLLVGESEIVPANSIFIGSRHHTSDFRYADTISNEIDPELLVGRIPGNTAYELIQPLHTIINVYRHTTGYGYDASDAFLISGFPESRRGGSDYGDFIAERDDVRGQLTARGVVSEVMDTRDNETKEISEGIFIWRAPGKDIIHLTGHGNTGNMDDISIYTLDRAADPFGDANPIVYGSSCLTGQYTAGTSLAEKFLQKGAGVYLGSFAVSYITVNRTAAHAIYSRLEPGHSFGSILKQVKINLGSDDWWGLEEDDWTASYHLFGDPEYGADLGWVPSTTQASPTLDLSAGIAPLKDLIPMYQVTLQADGTHWVEIPGGGWVLSPGKPIVPKYTYTYDVTPGYQVQSVTLTVKDGLSTANGFNLPLFTAGLASGEAAAPLEAQPAASTVALAAASPVPQAEKLLEIQPGAEWWPDHDFSWSVSENPDGTSRLTIDVYPFFYNPLTQQARFYQDYGFEILGITAGLELVDLQLNKEAYLPGETLQIDAQVSNPVSTLDSFLSLQVFRQGESAALLGLPLQPLNGLTGNALLHLAWNSSVLPPGDYVLQTELYDLAGHLYDTRQASFTIGLSQGELQELKVTPAVFEPGQNVSIAYSFKNTGTQPLDATAVIVVQDLDSGVEQRFQQTVYLLAPGGTFPMSWLWQTTPADQGRFRVSAYVHYAGTTTPPQFALLQSTGVLYLPLVRR